MMMNPAQLIRSYELYQVLIEMAVIWVGVYMVFRFLRGTRGAGVIKGVAILLVLMTLLVRVLGQGTDTFGRLNFLYEKFLGLMAIVLIVVFAPELRQAMIRLSQVRPLRQTDRGRTRHVIGEVAEAAAFLSKNQFGALIAIERSGSASTTVEGGQVIDAEVSARLLEAIFWPNSPLHDLGVVIRGGRVISAGVQFPLAEEGVLPARTGSRHRAAVGLTMESDCIVVVVSEETGAVSIADRGRIETDIPRTMLEEELERRLLGGPRHRGEAGPGDDASPPDTQDQPAMAGHPRESQE